jgi:2-dehydro-3-deoxyphosphogluconate aldolase / (4S)-4-hydroxy-2-oxoglutarate aldolase
VTANDTAPPVLAAAMACRVIPVLTIDQPNHGAGVADALMRGGLPVAEVTLRSAGAEAVLARMAQQPGLLAGAGTVVRHDQVDRVHAAGARFVVCPGFDPDIVQRCRDLDLTVIPGISTATELQAAARMDVEVVKLFPAEAVGGLRLLSALAAPFPGMRFIPTGGITEENMTSYLSHPAVPAVGGSWIAPRAAVLAQDWDRIAGNAGRAVEIAGQAAAWPAT